MREDFAKISREIRTAQPHVPEVYLTVTRGISHERTQKIPQARHPLARFARKGLPLYERKPSRRIRDRYGAQADMRRRSDLLSSFLTETHESFQENNAERTESP